MLAGTPGATNPHEAYFFYHNENDLLAVRKGDWKLYVPQVYRSLNARPGGTNGIPAKYENLRTGLALYNLRTDISEGHNVAAQNPNIVSDFQTLLDRERTNLVMISRKSLDRAGARPGG